MLLGEYNHTIDEKGRLIIPAKFRNDLGENVVICKGLGRLPFCVFSGRMGKFRKRVKIFTTDEQGCQNFSALLFRKRQRTDV